MHDLKMSMSVITDHFISIEQTIRHGIDSNDFSRSCEDEEEV